MTLLPASRFRSRLVLLVLLFGLSPSVVAQEMISCLSQEECPRHLRCQWGVCDAGMVPAIPSLFQWSVLDIPDVTDAPGTRWIRDRLANLFVGALNDTAVFGAVRHGGRFPVDTSTLFDALRVGSAYVLAAHLQRFDGEGGTLALDVIDAEAGVRVDGLSGVLEFSAATVGAQVEAWGNRAVLHFTGRPGLLGARLACVRKLEPGVKEIFVLQYGSGRLQQLTHDRSLALLPSWTLDGRVAYTSYHKGRPMVFISGMEEPFVSFEGMNSGIEWSLDGSTAAITLSKDENSEIYLLEGTTGEVRARLTYHPGIDTSPTWSPDGSRLAFCSDRDGTPQLFVMNANGTNKERLTFSGTYNTSPDWHPYGPYLVYAGRTGSEFQVFRFDFEDGAVRQLTDGPGDSSPTSAGGERSRTST
jgi:tol-pal system beta propeller repeat protein TolB